MAEYTNKVALKIRRGASLESEFLGMLDRDSNVQVSQEKEMRDGSVRARITHEWTGNKWTPLDGWVTMINSNNKMHLYPVDCDAESNDDSNPDSDAESSDATDDSDSDVASSGADSNWGGSHTVLTRNGRVVNRVSIPEMNDYQERGIALAAVNQTVWNNDDLRNTRQQQRRQSGADLCPYRLAPNLPEVKAMREPFRLRIEADGYYVDVDLPKHRAGASHIKTAIGMDVRRAWDDGLHRKKGGLHKKIDMGTCYAHAAATALVSVKQSIYGIHSQDTLQTAEWYWHCVDAIVGELGLDGGSPMKALNLMKHCVHAECRCLPSKQVVDHIQVALEGYPCPRPVVCSFRLPEQDHVWNELFNSHKEKGMEFPVLSSKTLDACERKYDHEFKMWKQEVCRWKARAMEGKAPGAGHAVNIVGECSLGGVDHFVVRNSWGGTWGAAGYFLMNIRDTEELSDRLRMEFIDVFYTTNKLPHNLSQAWSRLPRNDQIRFVDRNMSVHNRALNDIANASGGRIHMHYHRDSTGLLPLTGF
jgi:hypothetical protein